MSIADKIQALNDGLLDCYTAVQAKGGTVPANKNLDNLPDAIASISGGGSTVDPYITFSTESGTNSLSLARAMSNLNLEYSYDTTNWTTWDLTTPLEFGGATKLYMRGTNETLGTSNSVYTQFAFSDDAVLVDCSGRITKLLKYNDERYDYFLSKSYSLNHLFYNCKALRTAPELPAVGLASYCYQNMFSGCTSLTTAPELPATTLKSSCYSYMFYGCTSLTTAPELPAMNLASSCYDNMFNGCTSLTTAPELPATTLQDSCYRNMFQNCTSLTTAPELPATTLQDSCYRNMFYYCTNLAYVKCLAENPTTSFCSNWLKNTSATGTFVKKTGVTWESGTSGIPTGWTVEEV